MVDNPPIGSIYHLHTTYSPCQLGDYMLPIPPIKGTFGNSIDIFMGFSVMENKSTSGLQPERLIFFWKGRRMPNIFRQILGTMKKRTLFLFLGGLVRGIPNHNFMQFCYSGLELRSGTYISPAVPGLKQWCDPHICVRFERGFNKRKACWCIYLILIEQI